jgi:GntR family phosphonate transport system transcriptional regulator
MTRAAIWFDIAATLRSEIAAGHYPPGQRLPTEVALAARFGVNRHTVRRALADLAAAGLVHARRGAGVTVTARPTDYPLGRRVRFHQNLVAAGRVPGRRILSLLTRAADAVEAQALHVAAGDPVFAAEGLSLADGQPIALFRSVFPAARLPTLDKYLQAEGSVTRALARAGVSDYLRISTRISAVAATPAQAVHLQLSNGAPLLLTVAVNADGVGTPVEYGMTWFSGEAVTLTLADGEALSGEKPWPGTQTVT